MIRFATLSYSSINLGDDIQTVATLPFLNQPSHSFDRDTLALQQSEYTYIILMNAWWAVDPKRAFPPPGCFLPVFIGFHLAQSSLWHFSETHCVAYLKTHAPIGCRDLYTMKTLQQWGVEAFFSGCLSTTFYKRDKEVIHGKIILVDAARADSLIPDSLKKEAIITTHRYTRDPATREKAVNDLLHLYRTSASMVITTRLHAALTCSAMGIPVVFFFNPKDPRASSATQIGLPMYPYYFAIPAWLKKGLNKLHIFFLWRWFECLYFSLRYTLFKKINWRPNILDFEKHKSELRGKTSEMIQTILQRFP
jgi:hypothetical protein